MEDLIARYMQVADRVRYLATLGIILTLIALYYFLVHQGMQDQIASLETEHQTLENTLAEKSAYAANLAKYQARHEQLTLSLNTARAMLPDNPDIPQFLAQLGNIGKDIGLIVDRIEPKPEHSVDFYAEIPIAMKVRGSYHDVAMFIDQVGHLDRIVNVIDLSLINPKLENQKVITAGDFLIKTYRFLTEEQVAALAEKAKKDKK